MKLTLLLQDLAQQLLPVYQNLHTATDNAWWLLEALTQNTKTELLTQGSIVLTNEQHDKLADWLHEIVVKHKPLQYVVGTVPFLNCMIRVKQPILIPRPETEEWVANLIAQLHAQITTPNTILDMCTGTGCIALALAQAFPESAVCAVDLNPAALALAQENADLNECANVYFIHSDLFTAVPPLQFNLIVSNPPYISKQDWETLENNVKAWEDPQALVAEEQGYALIEKIITQAPQFLAPDAHLVIEIGHEQGRRVQELFEQHGFADVEIIQDMQKKDRVVRGTWRI